VIIPVLLVLETSQINVSLVIKLLDQDLSFSTQMVHVRLLHAQQDTMQMMKYAIHVSLVVLHVPMAPHATSVTL
jgi:hypothetical protein